MTGPYGLAATRYWVAGWRGVLPLPPGRKSDPPRGYTGHDGAFPSFADVYDWSQNAHCDGNVALRLPPDVLGIDVDAYDSKTGGATLAQWESEHGGLPPTWVSTSRDDGISGIRLFKVEPGLAWPTTVGPATSGIEIIRREHRYAVVAPSVHPGGATYRWLFDGVATSDLPRRDDLPWLPDAWVGALTGGVMAAEHSRADVSRAALAAALARYPVGQPCGAVRTVLARGLSTFGVTGSRHDAALRTVLALTAMAVDGHVGVPGALETLRHAWVSAIDAAAGSRAPGAAESEWERMVRGAVGLTVGAAPDDASGDPCDVRTGIAPGVALPSPPPDQGPPPVRRDAEPETSNPALVAQYVVEMTARDEARRIVAARTFMAGFAMPKPVTLKRLLEIPRPPLPYTVADVMPKGANVVLTAQFKTGKTTLVNHLVGCLADGHKFLNRFDVEPDPGRIIVVLNYEMSEAMYAKWLGDVAITNTDRVLIYNLRGVRMPLAEVLVAQALTRELCDLGVTDIIVDPHARAIGGLDENSNADMVAFTDALDALKRDTDAANLVLVNHTGRAQHEIGAEHGRGATRLDDWPDVRWVLTRNDEDVRFFRAMGRDVDVEEAELGWDPIMRSLTLGDGNGRKAQARTRLSEGEICDWVLRAVAATPGLSQSDVGVWIADERGRGVRNASTNAAIAALLSQGRLHNVEGGRRGRAMSLYLPEDRP